MGQAKLYGHAEAPIERVFDYAIDPTRWAEWNVSTVEMKPRAPLAKVGDHFAGKSKFMGQIFEEEGEVTQLERPNVIAFVANSPTGGHENWTARLTPAGTGTDVECVVDYEYATGDIDKGFVDRLVKQMLDQSMDNFKVIVEQEALQPV
ncbi:MAG: SRPBCC family protein [Chloroflexota bacterium]|jgi:uncharacterized protein YndB with AHSA1/START domain|nr:SRPBCC family protein [Chloroflexota bacterium]MDH5243953.1 SRPBCC family protein [Chloroflexota bacterium]